MCERMSVERAEWLRDDILALVLTRADGRPLPPEDDSHDDITDAEFWGQVWVVLMLVKELMPGVAEKEGTGSWGFAVMKGDPDGEHKQVGPDAADPASRLAMRLVTCALNDDTSTAASVFFAEHPDVGMAAFVQIIDLAAQLVNRRQAEVAAVPVPLDEEARTDGE